MKCPTHVYAFNEIIFPTFYMHCTSFPHIIITSNILLEALCINQNYI